MQAAVDAAAPGDTVRVAEGVFAGGVRIAKSLRLVGAGAGRTVIRGGGPVVTIDTPPAGPPTVSIADVTITGGVTHGSGAFAFGGGILVASAADGSLGANVSLRRVAVVGNRTAPTSTVPSSATCPAGPCPSAASLGGGIANFGNLTIIDSTVSDNLAGGVTSTAAGGGIFSVIGKLVLDSTVVADNAAIPASIGRFAMGGGVSMGSGDVKIVRSRIVGNRADLVTSWPILGQGGLIDMHANAGGILVGDGSEALIDDTEITGNSIRAVDPAGEPGVFDTAVQIEDIHLVMRDTKISHNSGVLNAATADDFGPSGSVMEVDGPATISDTQITDNPVSTFSADSSAAVTDGLAVFDFVGNPRQVSLRRVVISGNTGTARSLRGSATVIGSGILNTSLLDLTDVKVQRNAGIADAPQSTAQGGGIWNGALFPGAHAVLALTKTQVTENSLKTNPGGIAQGGGMYTTEPVSLRHSRITRNIPDQCFGCASTLTGLGLSSGPTPSQRRMAVTAGSAELAVLLDR